MKKDVEIICLRISTAFLVISAVLLIKLHFSLYLLNNMFLKNYIIWNVFYCCIPRNFIFYVYQRIMALFVLLFFYSPWLFILFQIIKTNVTMIIVLFSFHILHHDVAFRSMVYFKLYLYLTYEDIEKKEKLR